MQRMVSQYYCGNYVYLTIIQWNIVDRINVREHLDPFKSDALSCKSLLGLIHSIS